MSVKYSSTGVRHVQNGEAVNETVLKRPTQDLETRSDEAKRSVNLNEATDIVFSDYVLSTGSGTAAIESAQDSTLTAIPDRGHHHRLTLTEDLKVVGKAGEFELTVSSATLMGHYNEAYTDPSTGNVYNKENWLAQISPSAAVANVTGFGHPYKDPSTCIVLDKSEFSTEYSTFRRGEGLHLTEDHLYKLPAYNRVLIDSSAQDDFIERNGPGGTGVQLFDAVGADGYYPVLDRAASNFQDLYAVIESVTPAQGQPQTSFWYAQGFRGGKNVDANQVVHKDYLKVVKANNSEIVLAGTSGTRGNCYGNPLNSVSLTFYTINLANGNLVEAADASHLFTKVTPAPMDLTDKVVIPLVTLVSGEKFIFGTKSGVLKKPQATSPMPANTPLSAFSLPVCPVEQFAGTAEGFAGTDLIHAPALSSNISNISIPAGPLTGVLEKILTVLSTRDITTRVVYTTSDLASAGGDEVLTEKHLFGYGSNDAAVSPTVDDLNNYARVKTLAVDVFSIFTDNTLGPIQVLVDVVSTDLGASPLIEGLVGTIDPLVPGRTEIGMTTMTHNQAVVDISNKRITRVVLRHGSFNVNSTGSIALDITYNAMANLAS
jgi:hypothetical protein